jgi:hypothetical protein
VFNSFIGGHPVHELLTGIPNHMESGEQYDQAHEDAAQMIGCGKMLRVVEGQRKGDKRNEPPDDLDTIVPCIGLKSRACESFLRR